MNTQEHKILKKYKYHEHPRVLFFLCCLSFFVGIFYGSDGINFYSDILLLIFPLILSLLIGIKKGIHISVILAMSIGGYLLASSVYDSHIRSINSLGGFLGQKHHIIGTIEKKLYKTEFNQAYRLSFDNFDNISPNTVNIDISKPRILIEIPENLTLKIGDIISITGKLQGLYEGDVDGFEKYTLYHHLTSKISVSNFMKIQEGKIGLLESMSRSVEQYIFRGFPRDSAGIILGMTIGQVDLMGKGVQESFRTSGISHILVVSGSNITFLIVLLGGLLKYLPIKKYLRIILICTFVLIYSTLVGWDIPVLRSTIMGLLGYYAIEHNSRLSSIAVLLAVGFGFLIYSPLSMVYDPAFGLSFVATMSIILYYKRLYEFTQKYSLPSWIGSIFALSVSASVGTLPITLYHFGEVSVGTLFANIAIASVVGWILFFSVWYMLLGFLGEVLLYTLGWLIYLPVEYIIWIAQFFERWGTIGSGDDIKNIIIIIFLAFFSLEILRDERTLPLKDRKIHGPQ